MILPVKVLLNNKADELIDSAKNGAMTFHDDFHMKDKDLMKFVNTDLFPADRYKTEIISYKGDDAVLIHFGKIIK